jgi:hypothetical protein
VITVNILIVFRKKPKGFQEKADATRISEHGDTIFHIKSERIGKNPING